MAIFWDKNRLSRKLRGIGRAYHSEEILFSNFAEFDLRSDQIGDSANPEFGLGPEYLENGES